ncbi:hypothetical protein C7H85_15310 [Zobellella endophytica]|uniref:Uncharacterized protein n=1 Tax=Zobellella endophytica TaxID=2116700 RepID=A0A2P7R1L1_9GAMM|nr:hypothetical protein C7H85_15310 [Zobellella endophytica]
MPTSDSLGQALAATLRPAHEGHLVRLAAHLGAVMSMVSGSGVSTIRLPAWPGALEPVGGFLRVTSLRES